MEKFHSHFDVANKFIVWNKCWLSPQKVYHKLFCAKVYSWSRRFLTYFLSQMEIFHSHCQLLCERNAGWVLKKCTKSYFLWRYRAGREGFSPMFSHGCRISIPFWCCQQMYCVKQMLTESSKTIPKALLYKVIEPVEKVFDLLSVTDEEDLISFWCCQHNYVICERNPG